MSKKNNINLKQILIIGGALFLIVALFMMLLPGVKLNVMEDGTEKGYLSLSLFSLAFGGSIKVVGSGSTGMNLNSAVNIQALLVFIFFVIWIIICGLLIYGNITKKFSKKTNLICGIGVVVLCITSAILLFTIKNSAVDSGLIGIYNNSADFREQFVDLESFIKAAREALDEGIQAGELQLSLGIGAILASVFSLISGGAIIAGTLIKESK